MALTPTESQQLATLLSKVTSIEGLNTDLLALIRQAGQGGAVDIATHNISQDAHAALFGTKIRNRYTAAVMIYVRPDGNDSNSGLTDTAAGALKTLSGVLAWLRKTDMSGYTVTVILAPGTYAGAWWNSFGINCFVTIKSADSTNKAIISTAMTVVDYTHVDFQNIIFRNTVLVDQFGNAWFSGCDFEYQGAASGNVITVQRHSYIYVQPGCSISGTASTGFTASQFGMVNNWGDFTFNDTVFSNAAMAANRNGLIYTGATFAGSSTGRRYYVNLLALIDTNSRGPNVIPGTIDGVAEAATGGFYR